MTIQFQAILIEWRGPAPFLFAPLPADAVAAIKQIAREASYGWGCIPVAASANGVAFTTSLFPKDGGYMLPIKVAVQRETGLTVGDIATVELEPNWQKKSPIP